MTVETLDRPSHVSRTPVVRRRVLNVSLAGAMVVTTLAVATGFGGLAVLDVLLLGPLLGATLRMVRRRRRRCAQDSLAGSGWSAAELTDLAPLGAIVADGLPTWSRDEPCAQVPDRDRLPLLDRWTVTQVLWGGVAGWLYNRLAELAEALASSSSPGAVRRQLLRATTYLAGRAGRTVAVSALATAASTGLIAAAAGAATAPTSAASSGSSASAATSYTVQWGDTLTDIAARFGTTVAALAATNGIGDPDLIYAGQVLTIPGTSTAAAAQLTGDVTSSGTPAPAPVAAGTYTVQWGDTLTDIAARFGTTVAALAATNGIGDPDLIYAGQVLTIPGTSTAAAAQLTGDVTSSGTPAPAPAPTPTPTPATTATLLSTMPATVQATFACIVQHESSGNPVAYNPASQTMGLLQFLESTWLGYGGGAYAPTPLAATAQQQMDVGVLTYEQAGWSPWVGDGCV